MKVEFYRHSLGEREIGNVSEVLRSIFLTTGPVTSKFERRFSDYTGLAETVALNSCTGALHLALLALGTGPGDEVITTPMTFIATATSILQAGATPVFVDVEEDTGLMDVRRVREAVTPRTRAIIPVHLYGTMVDMRALRDTADRYGLKIIEDCAHCIEGKRDGVRPGHLGDAACFSFYATKNLTCGEGGALATRDAELAAKVRLLRSHGMSKDAAARYTGRYEHWDMVALGWKYNLDDIHAALLIDQIDRLEGQWKRREEIAAMYDQGIGPLPGIAIPRTRGKSARHLYTIWTEAAARDAILRGLQRQGVGVAVNYRAIHTLTYFRERFQYAPGDYPVALRIGERTLSLPFYPGLRDREIEYVIAAVEQAAAG